MDLAEKRVSVMDTFNSFLFDFPIKFHRFIYEFEFLEDAHLPPFRGSMLRGIFAINFKHTVCINKFSPCEKCFIRNDCGYYKVFETEYNPNVDLWFLQGVKKIPHPFIIHSQIDKKNNFTKGDTFKAGLTLFGHYSNYLPYFILTFERLGVFGFTSKKFKSRLKKVYSADINNNLKIVYDIDTRDYDPEFFEISSRVILEKLPEKFSSVKINFKTPLRIQENSSLVYEKDNLTSQALLRTLLRRIYAVYKIFYGLDIPQINLNFDSIKIDGNNLEYSNIARYSNRQRKKMEFGGLSGELTLTGESLNSIAPALILGSYFNIGKNTSFGYGEYELTFN